MVSSSHSDSFSLRSHREHSADSQIRCGSDMPLQHSEHSSHIEHSSQYSYPCAWASGQIGRSIQQLHTVSHVLMVSLQLRWVPLYVNATASSARALPADARPTRAFRPRLCVGLSPRRSYRVAISPQRGKPVTHEVGYLVEG